MTNKQRRKQVGLILVTLIATVCATPQFRNLVGLPKELRLSEGAVQELVVGFPIIVLASADVDGILKLNGLPLGTVPVPVSLGRPLRLESVAAGKTKVNLKLFGLFRICKAEVEVTRTLTLVPGGQSIGVLLHTDGVAVVGHATVVDPSGQSHRPALEAGVKVGDVIIALSGAEICDDEEIARLVDQAGRAGEAVELNLRRGAQMLNCTVKPVLCKETGQYRIGLYIRDAAAGVGTLTCWDPETKRFAALGHVVTDGQSSSPVDISAGRIVSALISGIEPGQRGQPGEKLGSFLSQSDIVGSIDRNTSYGIAGLLERAPATNYYGRALPVALAGQVKRGPAEIVTVVEGQRLEAFSIHIEEVRRQSGPAPKGMTLRVTDRRLLETTGGIVQGMSGSPIIQDGRLVGAVTHVQLANPAKGYGVFIEWMVLESGIRVDPRIRQSGERSALRISLPCRILSTHTPTGAGGSEDVVRVVRRAQAQVGFCA
ncbi:MAG: SpoIVB peptidase [Bacillota bacterium]